MPVLAAAAAVEAASGLLAASVAIALGHGHDVVSAFVACTVAAALADAVLVPGWVWVPGPFAPWPLLRRAGIAVATLPVAAILGLYAFVPFVMIFAALELGSLSAVLFALCFATGGAVAGLGAAGAQAADGRTGAAVPLAARMRSHVAGGAAGVLPIILASYVVGVDAQTQTAAESGRWWLLLILGPMGIVVGGLPHNLLVVRGAARRGHGPPPAQTMLRRVAGYCAVASLAALAAIVAFGRLPI